MSKDFQTPEKVIYVCTGSKCKKKGGKENGKALRELIKDMGLKGRVEVVKTECTDRCDFAPVMCFQPDNYWMHHTTEHMAKQAFKDHILNNPDNPA
ncbi:(2Fe-2S) ferredoxin domain-containing protein [Pontibacter burrus]|uniref:(2Fe-2S) ferredoxin domain-containing protein n=1 Tax=Pontibacter burrus TaxID=2704466 RepID=A0A6B3LST7_9BACT|nr:(2Fe-2S) ferredoxin domain-containing protein [Pontibacter burrus]NEM98115.1 (2Fe-2S) ferredoxin domain-containing protein [Pontibacter burrus]